MVELFQIKTWTHFIEFHPQSVETLPCTIRTSVQYHSSPPVLFPRQRSPSPRSGIPYPTSIAVTNKMAQLFPCITFPRNSGSRCYDRLIDCVFALSHTHLDRYLPSFINSPLSLPVPPLPYGTKPKQHTYHNTIHSLQLKPEDYCSPVVDQTYGD